MLSVFSSKIDHPNRDVKRIIQGEANNCQQGNDLDPQQSEDRKVSCEAKAL